jgi:hypothetical protein
MGLSRQFETSLTSTVEFLQQRQAAGQTADLAAAVKQFGEERQRQQRMASASEQTQGDYRYVCGVLDSLSAAEERQDIRALQRATERGERWQLTRAAELEKLRKSLGTNDVLGGIGRVLGAIDAAKGGRGRAEAENNEREIAVTAFRRERLQESQTLVAQLGTVLTASRKTFGAYFTSNPAESADDSAERPAENVFVAGRPQSAREALGTDQGQRRRMCRTIDCRLIRASWWRRSRHGLIVLVGVAESDDRRRQTEIGFL